MSTFCLDIYHPYSLVEGGKEKGPEVLIMVPRRYPPAFGGGQSKKEPQSHLVGWLPYSADVAQAPLCGWQGR
jgi:hypothetical protein